MSSFSSAGRELGRFLENVDRSGDCWLWTGYTEHDGYGRITVDYVRWRAHRLAWALFKGSIPTGMCICHHCDNPSCVNPDHLFLGTIQDNNRDKTEKGRSRGLPAGERHPQSKMTWDLVREMRAQHKSGIAPSKLSEIYPVCLSTVCRILKNKIWTE